MERRWGCRQRLAAPQRAPPLPARCTPATGRARRVGPSCGPIYSTCVLGVTEDPLSVAVSSPSLWQAWTSQSMKLLRRALTLKPLEILIHHMLDSVQTDEYSGTSLYVCVCVCARARRCGHGCLVFGSSHSWHAARSHLETKTPTAALLACHHSSPTPFWRCLGTWWRASDSSRRALQPCTGLAAGWLSSRLATE